MTRSFYGINGDVLSRDVAWLKAQVFEDRDYRNQAVIDRLYSVSERVSMICQARKSGEYDTWQGLRVSSSRLADALEIYRDKHAEDAPFPFVKEKGDFGIFANRALEELAQAAE
jgi:hypothetical protein